MTWLYQLYKTFENHYAIETDIPLTPVGHMITNAQIEVTLSDIGEFGTARILDKKEALTLIPVTEDSASRTSDVNPHPLCDMLPYIAGDFSSYCRTQKEKNLAADKFKAYMERLGNWAVSPLSHPAVRTIYAYLSKGCLISDLVNSELLEITGKGTFEPKKINGAAYDKVLVRFCIENEPIQEDKSLTNAWIQYYETIQTNRQDICYVTGKMERISDKHPKGIIPFKRDAKLISANDKNGFTYRGDFRDAAEAYALSYEVSQKAHSALTWLVRKYGVKVGSQDPRIFICWNPEGKPMPNVFENDESAPTETEPEYRKKLRKTLQGYTEAFTDSDNVLLMSLEAITTGRLSITGYQELPACEFLENVFHWKETCNWPYLKFTEDKKPYWEIETPVFHRILTHAFGREQGNFIEADEHLLRMQTPRLLSCMLERQPLPYDLVQALAIRASMPLAYSRGNRERVLSTACAMIRKHHYDKTKEMIPMELDLTNHNRSYLFGRLLAIYETVERRTYDAGETRDPNAIRLWSTYVNNPMQTWNNLEKAVNCYFQKLRPGSREYFRRMIESIVQSFEKMESAWLNQKLEPEYLLGYYLQRAEFNRKKEESKEESKDE